MSHALKAIFPRSGYIFFSTHILSLCTPGAYFTLLSTQSLLTFNLQANVCNVRHLQCTLHTVTSLFNWFGFGSINFSHPFSLLLLWLRYSLTHWPLIIFITYFCLFFLLLNDLEIFPREQLQRWSHVGYLPKSLVEIPRFGKAHAAETNGTSARLRKRKSSFGQS